MYPQFKNTILVLHRKLAPDSSPGSWRGSCGLEKTKTPPPISILPDPDYKISGGSFQEIGLDVSVGGCPVLYIICILACICIYRLYLYNRLSITRCLIFVAQKVRRPRWGRYLSTFVFAGGANGKERGSGPAAPPSDPSTDPRRLAWCPGATPRRAAVTDGPRAPGPSHGSDRPTLRGVVPRQPVDRLGSPRLR